MGRFFQTVIKFKFVFLLIIFIITALSIREVQNIKIDTSMEGLAPKISPEKQLHLKAVEEFGGEKMASIYIQDVNLFTPEKLQLLQELNWQIEEIPELESVYSVFTTPFIYNDGEVLNTAPLFEEIPESKDGILEKIDLIEESSPYHKFIIHPQKNSMLITIQFDPNQRPLGEVAQQIDQMIAPLSNKFEKIYQVGTPLLLDFTYKNIIKSFTLILPAIILVISCLIYFGTKSLNAATLPFIVAIISLLWTFSIMSLLEIPVQILTSCVPALAFVLGSTEITHLLSKYRQFMNNGFDHRESIILMGDKIGLAIILTALTTTFGFLTITVNEIQMLREFGLSSAIALVSNFLLMIFYLPIHLDLFQEKQKAIKRSDYLEKIKHSFLEAFDYLLTRRYLYFFLFAILSLSFYFTSKIYIENISWSQIKESSDLKKNLYRVNETFPGTNVMYFVLEAREKNFKTSANLNYLKKIQEEISHFNEVHHTQSLVNNIELIHREFNKDSIILDSIPKQDAMISQYLLSFSRENLAPFVSANYKRALIQIRHTNYTTPAYDKLVEDLERYIASNIDKEKYYAYYTSSDKILNKATSSLIKSQINSLSIIVIIIIITVALLFGDIRIALIAVPSNLIPIAVFFGVLGLFNIPLTTGSAMVAAVTIGIAIDDTIHFFVQYSYNLNKSPNPVDAAKLTIRDSSNAIITTSIALSCGFCLMALSDFIPLYHFGLLSAFVIFLAMICDLVITPSLITIFQLSNVVSYDNIFLTQVPVDRIVHHPLLKGLELNTLKKFIRQIGFSHINAKQIIEHDKDHQYLIIINGKVSELAPAQRISDENEHIKVKVFGEGDVIEINPTSQSHFQAEESTRYLLLKKEKLEQFIKSEYLSS